MTSNNIITIAIIDIEVNTLKLIVVVINVSNAIIVMIITINLDIIMRTKPPSACQLNTVQTVDIKTSWLLCLFAIRLAMGSCRPHGP